MTTSRAVELLTGPESAPLLQTALTGTPGAAIPGFTATLHELHDRPGAETSATYHVTYGEGPDQVADYLVATTAGVAGQAQVEVDGVTVQVWRHPADPRLPGLAGACTPEVLGSWLPRPTAGHGRPAGSADGDEPVEADHDPDHHPDHDADDTTSVLVYRPLRRAVLRTTRGAETFFTKVVRPDRGDLLVRRHELLAGLGPDVVATPEPGVLVTAHAPGTSLAVALSAWQLGESTTLPDPADALALLDRLPAEVLDLPARPSWTDRVDFHAATAARTLPEHAEEIADLRRQIEELAARFPVGPVVPTHGDFHEGNIFCEDGRPTRMIDVDTVGPGRREDDLACLVAHLAVLPGLSPGHYPRGAEITDSWARALEPTVHAGAFRIRVAGVLLSLVAGVDRPVALTRLDLARAWAWRAGSLPG